ncbi:ephexin isoform X2 [Rhynchophorus ferrugineus]|uniref:ephexin isoform X2 n=2 Tax=Rhynchophorus ferrugineus TaxID=354439 RepID=UPI003FCDC57D
MILDNSYTEMTTVNWQNAIAFDTSTVILELPYAEVALYPVLTDIQSNKSFLHSAGLNKSTLQLKRAFLEQSINDQQPEDVQMDEKSLMVIQSEHKRPAPKKISFKIKKQSSLHKRNFSVPRITNIPTNKVAELTKKFNEMVENQTMSREQVKMLVKRVDSVCGDPEKVKRTLTVGMHRDSSKVARKPSVKTKPTLEGKNLVIIRTKPGRKSSMKKEHNDKLTVRVKTTNTEPEETIPRPTTLNINKSLNIPNAIIETSPNGTSVREAIEIFERKSSPPVKPKPTEIPVQKAPTKVKPEIPEKSPILISLKDVSKSASVQNKEIPTDNTTASIENDSKETEEFDEDKVQIINIPAVLPQRRCDSMYETMHLRKISPDPKFKSAENIYKDDSRSSLSIQPNYSFLWRDKSASVPIANSKVPTPEDMKKLPPDIPPKPNVEPIKPPLPPKIIHKNALPSKISKPNCDRKLPDYEEIGAPVSSELPIGSDETFQNYDEITKPVDEVEKSEKIYEEITRPDSAVAFEHYEEIVKEEKIYEELKPVISKPDDGYEPIGSKLTDTVYEDARDENFYETLPVPPMPLRRQKQEPLPPRPPSSTRQEESLYNCYESIYTESKKDGYYESINGSQLTDTESNRDSVLSSDHKSNSLYGKAIPMWDCNSDGAYYKTASDISSDRVSNRSDEWEDMTDNDEEENKFIIVREKQRNKKSGWSQHFREQLSKTSKISIDEFGEEADHYYETLNKGKFDDFESDSFESDIESEISSDKIEFVNDSGIDIGNHQLPEPPNNQSNGLIKLAGKHMMKIKQNWKKDISKSLTRMKKHISKTDTESPGTKDDKKSDSKIKLSSASYENVENKFSSIKTESSYQNTEITRHIEPQPDDSEKTKSLSRKGGFLTKFRRSMSLSAESASELTSSLSDSKTKSTFYVTDTINIDNTNEQDLRTPNDKVVTPILKKSSKSPITRPNTPPPPAPVRNDNANRKTGKSASWYAESGLFRETTNKRPITTYWYAEVGLYESQVSSAASTSSSENSGSNLSAPIKPFEIPRPVLKSSDYINQDDQEIVNNMKNENIYYAGSTNSTDTKNDESLKQETLLRLQDEPLYQFYDAAIQESVSYDGTSDFDSDNYEDVADKDIAKLSKTRPTAMELVSPKRNSVCFTKTLWCEIPEVINSAVLSTLSAPQKKLQEAKFEILTSEASYLNSLNVLKNHFIKKMSSTNLLTPEELNILFGHVEIVRSSSEKLLHDLEKCWQDNILLHGICDIVQKHAEENFNVYIQYCENQVLFDEVLKVLKDRLGFSEFLSHLELSEVCQSLTLYSFLMLPMQRITRWPLLVEAVLKRLRQQDPEYFACNYALVAINKIVSQCNEAARNKEREVELRKISKKLEFPSNVPITPIFITDRYLVRHGPVCHIQPRNDDNKLTFGKKFVKTTIHLFLFNDLFVVSKEKSEGTFTIVHYCPRNLIELNSSEIIAPGKDLQSKHLIMLTMLENQDRKTVEYLLACNSESDKTRWSEALTPPKSQDPEETLYESWDCPQVSAIHNYTATQSDELSLTKGDVINVLRKLADGWYHGEKIRDGKTGWFPANHTVEIPNIHVRARNLRQRHKFLAFSEHYLKSK